MSKVWSYYFSFHSIWLAYTKSILELYIHLWFSL